MAGRWWRGKGLVGCDLSKCERVTKGGLSLIDRNSLAAACCLSVIVPRSELASVG